MTDKRIKHIIKEGQKFGRLLTLCKMGNNVWQCVCECGNIHFVKAVGLYSGDSKSCGCYRRDYVANKNKTHGLTKTRSYFIWADMMRRCYDERRGDYHHYGGRGIQVVESWHDVVNFYKDMGEAPTGMTLDRIDTNGDYSPENCRWADYFVQMNNTRRNVKYKYGNKKYTLAEISRMTGVHPATIRSRLDTGRSIEEATMFTDFRAWK